MRTHKHCGTAALIGAEIWLRSSKRVHKKKKKKKWQRGKKKKKVAGFKIINISVRKIVS